MHTHTHMQPVGWLALFLMVCLSLKEAAGGPMAGHPPLLSCVFPIPAPVRGVSRRSEVELGGVFGPRFKGGRGQLCQEDLESSKGSRKVAKSLPLPLGSVNTHLFV